MNDKNKMQQSDQDVTEDQNLEDTKGGMSEANTSDLEADVDSDLGDLEIGNYDQGPTMDSDTTDEE